MMPRNTSTIMLSLLLLVSIAASGCGGGGGGGTPPVTTANCAADLACSAPSGVAGDEICISGRVVDGTDLTKAIDAITAGNIEVRIYEPLNFLSNPTTPPFKTLTIANKLLDTCGRFTARFSVSGDAPNGVIAIATADLVSAGTNTYVLGATIRSVGANVNIASARAYLVSKAQDQALSTAAGLSSGTFASAGTLAVRYHQGGASGDALPGVPVKGIVPQWGFGGPPAADANKDYFFSDSSLTTLQTISASQNATGSNGISLLRTGTGIGNVTAGTACVTSGGADGALTVFGPTLTGTTAGAIVFHDVSVACQSLAGIASALTFTVQPQNATAGQVLPPVVVQVVNVYGDPLSTPASISLSVSGGAALSGTTTTAATSGTATFGDLQVTTAGTYTLTASAAGLTSGTSAPFTISVGPVAQFSLIASSTTVTAGTAFTITVTAKDAYGNITPAYTGTVAFTSSDVSATLPSNYTFIGGDNGVKTFANGVTLNAPGAGRTVTVTDTSSGTIFGSAAFTVTP